MWVSVLNCTIINIIIKSRPYYGHNDINIVTMSLSTPCHHFLHSDLIICIMPSLSTWWHHYDRIMHVVNSVSSSWHYCRNCNVIMITPSLLPWWHHYQHHAININIVISWGHDLIIVIMTSLSPSWLYYPHRDVIINIMPSSLEHACLVWVPNVARQTNG